MITIVDYGMGNIRSVSKALELLGYPSQILSGPPNTGSTDLIVLPGVGSFDHAIRELKQRGWFDYLKQIPQTKIPMLGMCLGLQLLFERSSEGSEEGLGIFQGDVIAFPASLRSPHMGWNTAVPTNSAWKQLLTDKGQDFYFVHSYFVRPKDSRIVAANTNYTIDFPSVIHSNRIVATQFHPEKSQVNGLHLLKNILNLLEVSP